MPLPFFQHFACLSHAHCTTCRAREAGRQWRANHLAAYPVEGVTNPDFDCPHGKEWGEVTTRPPEPIPDDHDVSLEQRRLKQGGCCGTPSE